MKQHTVIITIVGLCLSVVSPAWGQSEPVRWQRSAAPVTPELQLFHSTHSLNLPTAETHRKGDFEFEISHRFFPAISKGYEDLYGFDGPVNMRIALGYAVTGRMLVTLGRSNSDDNVDFWAKYKAFQIKSDILPTLIGFRAGVAWNPVRVTRSDGQGNLYVRHRNHKRNFQYYGQLILNAMPHKRIGLGLVPSYLINRDIRDLEREQSFVLGVNAQVYFSRFWSILGEWAATLTDKYGRHNPGAIGIELETGGHFFKVFVTNQTLLNPSQYLAGSEYPFDGDNLRFGFLITRLL